jgi:hypothetical protein
MQAPIDDATEQFLIAAADDLQQRLGLAAVVDRVAVKASGGSVALVATLRIGHRLFEVWGTGADLVAAYSDLRLPTAEAILGSAYSELMEASLPPR